jgi:vitamin B12 transporter
VIRIPLLLILLAVAAMAQSTVTVRGTVSDPDGAAVPEARVMLYRQGSTDRSTASTDAQGTYTLGRVQPGRYVLEVDKSGFRKTTLPILVESGSTARQDVTLALDRLSQSVIVTANDAPQTVDEVSKAVSVLSAEDLQARNEIGLGEGLRTVPGVQVVNLGGPGQITTARIRGLRPDATAVLIDGLRFRDASTLQGDASSVFSALNFNGTERVEVLRGSGSSLYGTNAVGGVVNVITQDGGSPTHGSLLLEGGQLGLLRGKASVGGGAREDRLRYSGSLLHLNVLNGVDGNDAARHTGGQGFLRYDLTPAMTLTGRVLASDDFVQLNVSPSADLVPLANIPDQMIVPARMLSTADVRLLLSGGSPNFTGVTLVPAIDDPDNRRTSRHHSTAAILRHMLSPSTSWQSSYQRVHTSRTFQDGPAGPGFYQPVTSNFSHYIGDIDTFDLRGTTLVGHSFSLTGGYEFEREYYFDHQDNNLPGVDQVTAKSEISQRSNAGYFASQLKLLNHRLQISTSGRSQFFQLARPHFTFSGTANNYATLPLQAPPKAITGDVSIAYMLQATDTKLRAHVGNAYRAPSLYERFGGMFGHNWLTRELEFTAFGDPRLAPDRYNNVDAGIDQYFFNSRVRASATWFYSRVVSLTGFDSSGAINPSTDPYGRFSGYINGSGGISRGVELSVEAKPTTSTTVHAAYTYVNADLDQDLSVKGFYPVLRVQNHVTTFVVTQAWTRRLSTNVDFFYGSEYFDPYYAAGRARAFRNPGFAKADLVGSYLVWEGEGTKARLYGKVENLFDNTYYHGGYLAPGATGTLGLQLHF